MLILYFRIATDRNSGNSCEPFLFTGSFLSVPKLLLVVKLAHIKLPQAYLSVRIRKEKTFKMSVSFPDSKHLCCAGVA